MTAIINNLLLGLKQIGSAFIIDPSIWWLITPVIIFWIVIEIYFDRYKKEELGWNTALGNGLSILWVSFICLKFLFEDKLINFLWSKFIAILFIFLYGAFIVFNSYHHELKKKISFLLASPTPIYFFSLVAILWTYGFLPITFWTVINLIILYIIIGLLELLLKKLIKPKEVKEETPEIQSEPFPPSEKI